MTNKTISTLADDPHEFFEYLSEWYELSKSIKKMKAKELEMRKIIFANAFKDPDEGTNKITIGEGFELKAVYNYNYTPYGDIYSQQFTEVLEGHGIVKHDLLKMKASISKAHYKNLTIAQQEAISDYVTIKPGLPALDIVKIGGKE